MIRIEAYTNDKSWAGFAVKTLTAKEFPKNHVKKAGAFWRECKEMPKVCRVAVWIDDQFYRPETISCDSKGRLVWDKKRKVKKTEYDKGYEQGYKECQEAYEKKRQKDAETRLVNESMGI
jgi:hypothetical protein